MDKMVSKLAPWLLVFLLGAAAGNAYATHEALEGQKHYFVHKFCPKIAAKAAGRAVEREKAREESE